MPNGMEMSATEIILCPANRNRQSSRNKDRRATRDNDNDFLR